jgi:hypothetical protein
MFSILIFVGFPDVRSEILRLLIMNGEDARRINVRGVARAGCDEVTDVSHAPAIPPRHFVISIIFALVSEPRQMERGWGSSSAPWLWGEKSD